MIGQHEAVPNMTGNHYAPGNSFHQRRMAATGATCKCLCCLKMFPSVNPRKNRICPTCADNRPTGRIYRLRA
jgi:Zn finger protein HypA/HybF involved in hydrogenase expression